MEITRLNPLSQAVPCKSKGTGNSINQIDFQKVTTKFNIVMNDLLETPGHNELTEEKLKTVSEKFWTSAPGIKAIFCSKIWGFCKDEVEEFSKNTQPKIIPEKIKTNKKPIIFSTGEEGLGITIDLIQQGSELVAKSICTEPGGCPINVARALNNLGSPFELISLKGYGPRATIFTNLLGLEGIDSKSFHEVDDDIRFYFCAFVNGKEYWTVSPKPYIAPNDIDRITTQLIDTCKENKGEALALSILPFRGAKENFMHEIINTAQKKASMFVIYDSKIEGVPEEFFNSIVKTSPSMIKPNLAEFSQLVNVHQDELREDHNLLIHLAQGLIEKHDIKLVLVSLDKDGAILIDRKRVAYAPAPKITVACTIGAGDTGIASLIDRSKKDNFSLKKLSDKHFKDILSAFVAGGAATATKPGTELASLEEVQDMEKQIKAKFV